MSTFWHSPLTPVQRPHSAPLLVICNAPLVAPIPLPYHPPTFLQFDLPDIDQDLSRPPYIKETRKRKREADDLLQPAPAKRPLFTHRRSTFTPPTSRYSKQHHDNTTVMQRAF